jgi:excisionase family DNA binding protein
MATDNNVKGGAHGRQNDAEWISVAEVQEILGIGRTKAYELVATGEIKAARVGRAVRVNRAAVDAYIERNQYAQGWR